jgi:glutathione S-transferase
MNKPEQPLILYEYEACPMCRRVRQAIDDLALPVEIRPCPRDGERFRPEATARSGKQQFPYLLDPNAGVELLESEDIVAHLYRTYSDGEVPARLKGPRFVLTSMARSLSRGRKGFMARGSGPNRRLELRGAELDRGARRVRERLCELEIPYLRTPGALQLRDPTTGTTLDDPGAILAYLSQ